MAKETINIKPVDLDTLTTRVELCKDAVGGAIELSDCKDTVMQMQSILYLVKDELNRISDSLDEYIKEFINAQ